MSTFPFPQAPQARFRVVEQPGALPGCCFACSGSYSPDPPVGRIWFVDLGMNLDFQGAIYLCNLCLAEMANTVGWVTPEDALLIHEKVKGLERDLFHAQTELASLHDLENLVGTYVQSRDRRRSSAGGVSSGVAVPLYVLPGNGEDAEDGGTGASGPSGAADQPREGTGTVDEPSDGQGVVNVHSDDPGNEFRLGL